MERRMARAIEKASEEVMQGRWDDQFVVDIFQTGSGTSTNMNANEVIANRANEILGGRKGIYDRFIRMTMSISDNRVTMSFPPVIHIASVNLLQNKLIPALRNLHHTLRRKEKEFHSILKIGRTHLQDATPIRLGQEFGGYARQVQLGIRRIQKAMESLSELPLGGTAVGTGINTHPLFAKKAISVINERTGERFREAADHFEAQGAEGCSGGNEWSPENGCGQFD